MGLTPNCTGNGKYKYYSTGRFKTTTQETYQSSYIYLINKSDIPNDSFLMYRIEKSHSV